MQTTITAHTLSGKQQNYTLASIPDACPMCHRNIDPKKIASFHLEGRNLIQSLFQCTHFKCQEVFIGTYAPGNPGQFALMRTSPTTPKKEDFSEIIRNISATFVEIYNQALSAESANLPQLVGIGIRKALEFLVKDFAVNQHPGKEVEIRKLFIGQCIEEYIQDANVKACAKRAAWLGNDETHYTRKWEDKDINDLKLLTKLTVNWIENVVLTKKYISEMDEKK